MAKEAKVVGVKVLGCDGSGTISSIIAGERQVYLRMMLATVLLQDKSALRAPSALPAHSVTYHVAAPSSCDR